MSSYEETGSGKFAYSDTVVLGMTREELSSEEYALSFSFTVYHGPDTEG